MLDHGMIRAAGLVAALLSAGLTHADDGLSRLLPNAAGASACFARVYDAEHLAAHPRQKARALDLVLSRREAGGDVEFHLTIAFAGSGRTPSRVFARCADAGDNANSGETGRKLVPNFPHKTGLACQALAGLFVSGEASGAFPVALDPDGKFLTLYFRETVVTFADPVPPEPVILALGSEDRMFRLERTDTCAGPWR